MLLLCVDISLLFLFTLMIFVAVHVSSINGFNIYNNENQKFHRSVSKGSSQKHHHKNQATKTKVIKRTRRTTKTTIAQHQKRRDAINEMIKSTATIGFGYSSSSAIINFDGRNKSVGGDSGVVVGDGSGFATSNVAQALTPEEASIDYDMYAKTYNQLDGGIAADVLGIETARSDIISKASGDVLEIGVGTGLNLDKYIPKQITSLTLVDISDNMLKEAKDRIEQQQYKFPVKYIKADATTQLVDLFGCNVFDTVVDTFSLCVMGNDGAKKCLNQISNVVKPSGGGGQVLLLENNRSSSSLLGWYQDVTATTSAKMGGKGCIYNQNVHSLILSTTPNLIIKNQKEYAAGLFRSFICIKEL